VPSSPSSLSGVNCRLFPNIFSCCILVSLSSIRRRQKRFSQKDDTTGGGYAGQHRQLQQFLASPDICMPFDPPYTVSILASNVHSHGAHGAPNRPTAQSTFSAASSPRPPPLKRLAHSDSPNLKVLPRRPPLDKRPETLPQLPSTPTPSSNTPTPSVYTSTHSRSPSISTYLPTTASSTPMPTSNTSRWVRLCP
jgi:hypothetical protein